MKQTTRAQLKGCKTTAVLVGTLFVLCAGAEAVPTVVEGLMATRGFIG